VDAYGQVLPNACHDVWLDAVLQHVVADWKDRYCGRLTHERIHSRVLAGERELLIWLPPSYALDSLHRYPVIFLHDGANVFDPKSSIVTGVDWAADEWVNFLTAKGAIAESIVIGICHPEGFTEDSISARDFDLSLEMGGAAYAQFVATELVPFIDQHYRTIAKSKSRVLGGAGLGALNSFHTALNHPGVFGGFVCLSTSFEDVSGVLPAQASQLKALEAEPALEKGIRIYFDHGDHGLDECYEVYHHMLDTLLREKGWQQGSEFKIACVPGGSHTEISWRQRFGDALRFVAG
jgi:enterochelin esterase-like enzyme